MTDVQTGFAPVNGAKLYYEVAGEGFPLVLVHAGICDSRMWDAQFQAFAAHYKTIRYDQRGYGKSEPVAEKYTRYDELHGLLKFLNIERAHLLGCSVGGRAVIDFALTYPEMVAALIPVGASPGGYEYTGKEPKQTVEIVAAFERGDLERVSELEVQVWVDGTHRTADQIDPSLRQLVYEMNLQALQYEKLDLGEERPLDTPAIRRLGELKLPTLVMVGDLDTPRVVMASHVMQAQIAGAQKVVISGTAHLPNMEKPEEFNNAVLGFLQSL